MILPEAMATGVRLPVRWPDKATGILPTKTPSKILWGVTNSFITSNTIIIITLLLLLFDSIIYYWSSRILELFSARIYLFFVLCEVFH